MVFLREFRMLDSSVDDFDNTMMGLVIDGKIPVGFSWG